MPLRGTNRRAFIADWATRRRGRRQGGRNSTEGSQDRLCFGMPATKSEEAPYLAALRQGFATLAILRDRLIYGAAFCK